VSAFLGHYRPQLLQVGSPRRISEWEMRVIMLIKGCPWGQHLWEGEEGGKNWGDGEVKLWSAQSCLTLWPHGLQHTRPPCPSPTPRACSNSCPSSQWCHPTISSSVIPFSSCLQSFPASGSFPMNWLFISGGQSTGVSASASVLPVSIQDWFPLGLTSLISLHMYPLLFLFIFSFNVNILKVS